MNGEVEKLIDEAIYQDLPNMVLDIYEQETGLEPVPENGGHTQDFEDWFASAVHIAYTEYDRRTIEELKEYFELRRDSSPDHSTERTNALAYKFADYGINGAGADESAEQKKFAAECIEVSIRLMQSSRLSAISSPNGSVVYDEAQLTGEWRRLSREAKRLRN